MSTKFCKDCEFFMPAESMADTANNIKFGVCIKSLRTVDKSFELVTGFEQKIKPEERFNHAQWERKCGDCGVDGKHFEQKKTHVS